MWSTELNMWSDVRGRLLTLRPLSVLSLREWALHKTQSHQYLITFWSDLFKLCTINEQQSIVREQHRFLLELVSVKGLFLMKTEPCWQVNKSWNWNFLMERYTSVLSAGHMVFHLSPLHGGGSRKNMQEKGVIWVTFRERSFFRWQLILQNKNSFSLIVSALRYHV